MVTKLGKKEAWACEGFGVAYFHGCFWVVIACNGKGRMG